MELLAPCRCLVPERQMLDVKGGRRWRAHKAYHAKWPVDEATHMRIMIMDSQFQPAAEISGSVIEAFNIHFSTLLTPQPLSAPYQSVIL